MLFIFSILVEVCCNFEDSFSLYISEMLLYFFNRTDDNFVLFIFHIYLLLLSFSLISITLPSIIAYLPSSFTPNISLSPFSISNPFFLFPLLFTFTFPSLTLSLLLSLPPSFSLSHLPLPSLPIFKF